MAALPYALRRALSPSTENGQEILRTTLLDENGFFRFKRFQELIDQAEAFQSEEDEGKEEEQSSGNTSNGIEAKAETGAVVVKKTEMNSDTINGISPSHVSSTSEDSETIVDNVSFGFEAVGSILGAPEGAALRRVLADADTFALVCENKISRRGANNICKKKILLKKRRGKGWSYDS